MAGLPWFKLHGDFFSHPKTLELQEELGDPCADVYVVRMWAYVSRVAASGRLTGRNVAAVLERAIGWGGLPGRFVTAAVAVGFLEQDGEALVVHDWEREQGAHVAKVERDRKRPNSKARMSDDSGDPARGFGGVVAGPRENPEVEREMERESKRKASASQANAAASPQPEDALPDGAADAEEVSERPALVLEAPTPPAKKPREVPPGEVLYMRLEDIRREECARVGVPFVPSRWPFSRQNKDLGPIAKLPDGHEDKARFEAAWGAFLDDPQAPTLDEPFSLSFFWKMRSRYEGRGLKGAA